MPWNRGFACKVCVLVNRGSRVWPMRPRLAMRTKPKSSGIFRLCHLVCYDSHEPRSVYSEQKRRAAAWFLNKAFVKINWSQRAICYSVMYRIWFTVIKGDDEWEGPQKSKIFLVCILSRYMRILVTVKRKWFFNSGQVIAEEFYPHKERKQ